MRSAEYALVSHEAREVCEPATGSAKKCENYNIGRVILKDSHMGEEDRTALQLQFYIILTSSQKMFPHTTLENLQLRSKVLSTSISGIAILYLHYFIERCIVMFFLNRNLFPKLFTYIHL